MEKSRFRIRFFVCAVCLCICLPPGCSRGEAQSEKEDIPVIYIGITGNSGMYQNLERVNTELEKQFMKKLGVRVRLVNTGLDSADNYYKNRRLGVDILGMYYSAFCSGVQKNLLLDIKDYLDTAPALQAVLDEKAAPQDLGCSGVYGVPKPISDLHSNGAILNRACVEKYGFDVSCVRQAEDLEPFFEVIRSSEPDMVPWALEKSRNAVLERQPIADLLDGCLSGIMYEDNQPAVCNIYETKAYEERVKLAKRWQERGYLAGDILTCIENGKNMVLAGEAFAAECVVKPDETQYDESIYGDKMIIVPFENRPVLDTEDDWIYVWGISADTAYPKEAVEALNLLYCDPEILNIVLYGVEGTDYVVGEDGRFHYPAQDVAAEKGYTNTAKWKFNTLKAGVWEGMSLDLQEDFARFADSAVYSSAYGFWLDEKELTVDLAKLRQIVNEYTPWLETGLCDTDSYLEEFRQKLKEAGSERLVEEVQRQLDDWKMSEKE
ncbi:ABC transporter substrate-binding protein [Lachnospiraceae bacterium 45-W7]